ncbi:CDP-glycerol glycerophosphotransferase family protein [Pseudomonas arcuscaelestis]|jgi:YidC/Oxa1 family membrane protein insertase|uniref:CDP-glycerol glycerophosphotransferase family protein n=1 Tax=Pseudomonas arcuscaelestis TaxID=2710591 RepID=UPI00193D3A58|nr:CDP-glycerol glycerophosphotransferase family protein [Pseudomonas arcuscaelestis]MBM3111553.1 CDP-glycerol glycerophosphotransferase family protein [Pseudomonas arcuscaelestis]
MFAALRRVHREWKGLQAFKRVPREERKIVFYSEGKGYWSHFEPVFSALQANHNVPVLYVTSAEDDPLLLAPPVGMHAFYIGEGSMRTLFFSTLDVDVLLMTMPDLQSFHIKRSPFSVHYAYLHHSIVSTHMIYRAEAFDHFDSILCVGPHHAEETRAREQALNLPAKKLVEHGYGRLDTIIKNGNPGPLTAEGLPIQVLIAPTWGQNGLIETHGIDAVRPFIESGLRVILRPHPRTRKFASAVLDEIAEQYRNEPLFRLDEDGDGNASLLSSDIMLSDWSGAALEFAFGLERPVIFADVPRKVLNPDYTQIGLEPLEVQIREQLGVVVPTDRLNQLGGIAQAMVADSEKWQATLRAARQRWIFNTGKSGDTAAAYLTTLLN